MLKDTLQQDLKAAMLARETEKVETLKGLKTAILYAEVAANKRDEGLSDDEVLAVLKKESKKRADAIALYQKGGNEEMALKEQAEKDLIDAYLPEQMDESAIEGLVDQVLSEMNISELTRQDMGKVIGAVKGKAGNKADGAVIAKVVQGKITA